MYQSFDGEIAGNSFALRLFTIIIRPLIEKGKYDDVKNLFVPVHER